MCLCLCVLVTVDLFNGNVIVGSLSTTLSLFRPVASILAKNHDKYAL